MQKNARKKGKSHAATDATAIQRALPFDLSAMKKTQKSQSLTFCEFCVFLAIDLPVCEQRLLSWFQVSNVPLGATDFAVQFVKLSDLGSGE